MTASSSARTSATGSPTQNPFVITRVFNAPRGLVWKAFTQCEHLKHWWGPKGFKVLSCKIDLRPGGVFHYGMQSPDGKMMWGKFIYREIIAPERLVHIVSFSDENQGVTRHPMAPTWPLETLADATFTESGGKTTITVRWSAHNATPEERAVFDASHDSMRQGWTGTMDQLDAYLAKAKT
jgi:uncharacterized protein YndB with AHSA1/START domain